MRRPRRYTNLWRLLFLIAIAAFLIYVNNVVEPLSPDLFLPTFTPTIQPETFVSQAEKYLEEGKYNLALQEYQKAIQSDPKDPANFISAARINVYAGDYSQAAVNASNALLLSPDSSMAEALKGLALGLSGEYLTAEASLKRASELDPSNAFAYAYQAIVYAQQIINGQTALGSLDNAIEASRQAVAIAPAALETHWRAEWYWKSHQITRKPSLNLNRLSHSTPISLSCTWRLGAITVPCKNRNRLWRNSPAPER